MYHPQLGDEVWTTKIAPGNEAEIKKGATRGIVRKVNRAKTQVNVVYGAHHDYAWVSTLSCTLIKRGSLDPILKEKINPFVFT